MRNHYYLLFLVVGTAPVACSSNPTNSPDGAGGSGGSGDSGGSAGSAGSGGSSSLSKDEAATAFAEHYCKKLLDCAKPVLEATYTTESACVEAQKTRSVERLGAPATGLTPEHEKGCGLSFADTACADFLALRWPAACNPMTGSLAAGNACFDDSQCTSGFCNLGDRIDGSQPYNCGFCSPGVPSEGSVCDGGRTCPRPLACANTQLGPTCRGRVPVGAQCNGSDGIHCDQNAYCNNGTCVAAAGLGEACSDTMQCDSFQMIKCDTAAGQCVPLDPGICYEGICPDTQPYSAAICKQTYP